MGDVDSLYNKANTISKVCHVTFVIRLYICIYRPSLYKLRLFDMLPLNKLIEFMKHSIPTLQKATTRFANQHLTIKRESRQKIMRPKIMIFKGSKDKQAMLLRLVCNGSIYTEIIRRISLILINKLLSHFLRRFVLRVYFF